MIGIGAFEYHDIDVGPYDEIGISVPIQFSPGFVLPFFTAFTMRRKGIIRTYIHHLPVTTEKAMNGGIHYFWNYPKFLGEITFQDRGENLEIVLREKGEMILELNSTKPSLNQSKRFEMHTYSIKGKTVTHSLIEGWAPKFGFMMRGVVSELELGAHWISQELAELNIGKIPKTVGYAEGAMGKLHEPDTRWNVDTLKTIDP